MKTLLALFLTVFLCPDSRRAEQPRKPTGWFCFTKSDGANGFCAETQNDCLELFSRQTNMKGDVFVLPLCSWQKTVWAFTLYIPAQKLTMPCALPTKSICEKFESNLPTTNPDDILVSHCAATR